MELETEAGMLRRVLFATLISLSLAACGQPQAGGAGSCPGGKCDSLGDSPRVLCSEERLAADTPVFASADEPDLYYALPTEISITRIASHYPLLLSGSGSFSEEELAESPFYGRNHVEVSFALDTAESLQKLETLLGGKDGGVRVRRLPVTVGGPEPASITWTLPDRGDLLSQEVEPTESGADAALVLNDDGQQGLLSFFRERAGVQTATLPIAMRCVDESGADSQRTFFPQTSGAGIDYEAPGIELARPTEPLEGAEALLDEWSVLESDLEWVRTWHDGPVLDASALEGTIKTELLAVVPYGDGSVSEEQVDSTGSAVDELVLDAFSEHLSTFDLESAAPAEHLEAVYQASLEGDTSDVELTPIDATFARIHERARALATFKEAAPDLEAFSE